MLQLTNLRRYTQEILYILLKQTIQTNFLAKITKPIPGKNNKTNLFNRWTSQSTTLSLVRPGPLTRQFLAPVEPLPTFSHLPSRDAAGRYQFSQCSQKWGQRKSTAMPAAVQGDHMKQQFKKCDNIAHNKKAFSFITNYACMGSKFSTSLQLDRHEH